jgi:hypothetical protein
MNTAQRHGVQADRVLRHLQTTLDTLPDGHPALPYVLEAVALAAVQWRAVAEGPNGRAVQRRLATPHLAGQGASAEARVF